MSFYLPSFSPSHCCHGLVSFRPPTHPHQLLASLRDSCSPVFALGIDQHAPCATAWCERRVRGQGTACRPSTRFPEVVARVSRARSTPSRAAPWSTFLSGVAVVIAIVFPLRCMLHVSCCCIYAQRVAAGVPQVPELYFLGYLGSAVCTIRSLVGLGEGVITALYEVRTVVIQLWVERCINRAAWSKASSGIVPGF